MSRLAAPRQQPRASQSLGGVKCSACGDMIPIEELGNHDTDCRPQPVSEVPKLAPRADLPKPLISPTSTASLLPQRLQGRVNTPGRTASPPPQRPGSTHSQSSSRSEVPRRQGTPEITPQRNSTSNNTPLNPRFANREPRGPSPLSRLPAPPEERARTQSAAPRPSDLGPDRLLRERTRTPSDAGSLRAGTESSGARPSFDSVARPSFDDPGRAPYQRAPSTHSQTGWTPQLPVPAPEPDTKVGGDAGMAGVGRRGFAAAARAAMFSVVAPVPLDPQGMDGRRANAPRTLDIDTAETNSGSGSSRSTTTPPLSAGSGSSSHSPPHANSSMPKTPEIAPRVPFFEKFRDKLPNVITNSLNGLNTSAVNAKDDVTEPAIKDPSSAGSGSQYTADLDFTLDNTNRPRTPLSDSDSDYGGGLAYADSDDEPASLPGSILRSVSSPSQVRFPTKNSVRARASSNASSASRDMSVSGGKDAAATRAGRERSASNGSSTSSKSASTTYSRSTAQSNGALGRAMETLFEDGATATNTSTSGSVAGGGGGKTRVNRGNSGASSSSASAANNGDRARTGSFGSSSGGGSGGVAKAQRSNTLNSPEPARALKLPTRSLTSPTQKERERETTARPLNAVKKTPKKRSCAKCEKDINDGRWVQMDAGGVLCEKCWKNMYLPKCRRCNLVIESKAVSSSDGQLKGKYHRECFNCATCQKPFPDKSFYVYDGKPLCAFHYHEANDSLCSAAKCGQPIEGPCAVSHAGDRYHPQHLTCEYAGNPRCHERLEEYYEVDGRMLCERHANTRDANADEDDEDYVPSARAMKRTTRFIDLGADGGGFR